MPALSDPLRRVSITSRPLRFALVGALAFCADALALEVLVRLLALDPLVARLFSWLCAATVAWYLNRSFTFRLTVSRGLLREWLHYLLANTIGGIANYAVFALLVMCSPSIRRHPILGVAAGALAGMCFNYFASRFWVFRSLHRYPCNE